MNWTRLEPALQACPVVPVLTIPSAEHAEPLARALEAGGITVSETTLRTPAGIEAVQTFRSVCNDMVVGVGSILDEKALTASIDAGADFVVTPGFDMQLLEALVQAPVPALPGVSTPSEAMMARRAGLRKVKLFPAEVVGGAEMLKGLAGPIPDMSFMPTGGVTLANMAEYLALPNVYAVGGTWIAKAEHLEAGDWDGITARAREAVDMARAARG